MGEGCLSPGFYECFLSEWKSTNGTLGSGLQTQHTLWSGSGACFWVTTPFIEPKSLVRWIHHDIKWQKDTFFSRSFIILILHCFSISAGGKGFFLSLIKILIQQETHSKFWEQKWKKSLCSFKPNRILFFKYLDWKLQWKKINPFYFELWWTYKASKQHQTQYLLSKCKLTINLNYMTNCVWHCLNHSCSILLKTVFLAD